MALSHGFLQIWSKCNISPQASQLTIPFIRKKCGNGTILARLELASSRSWRKHPPKTQRISPIYSLSTYFSWHDWSSAIDSSKNPYLWVCSCGRSSSVRSETLPSSFHGHSLVWIVLMSRKEGCTEYGSIGIFWNIICLGYVQARLVWTAIVNTPIWLNWKIFQVKFARALHDSISTIFEKNSYDTILCPLKKISHHLRSHFIHHHIFFLSPSKHSRLS